MGVGWLVKNLEVSLRVLSYISNKLLCKILLVYTSYSSSATNKLQLKLNYQTLKYFLEIVHANSVLAGNA